MELFHATLRLKTLCEIGPLLRRDPRLKWKAVKPTLVLFQFSELQKSALAHLNFDFIMAQPELIYALILANDDKSDKNKTDSRNQLRDPSPKEIFYWKPG